MTPVMPRPTTEARPELVTRDAFAPRRPAWVERATSADHKTVALLYIGAALSFLVLALVEFGLMRVQLIVPDSTIIQPETFARLLAHIESDLSVFVAFHVAQMGLLMVLPLWAHRRTTGRLARLAPVHRRRSTLAGRPARTRKQPGALP